MPTPLPIDLVEPDAPAPVGDRLPCHLFAAEVDWPTAAEAVLRADKPSPAPPPPPMPSEWLGNPPRSCPPCSGHCRQGRACPTFAPQHAARVESLRDAEARHRRFGRRLLLAVVVGWLALALFLVALP